MSKEVPEYRTPITAKSVIITSIFLVSAVVLSTFTGLYRGVGIFLKFMLPFFYIAMFNVLLGKINSRLKLNGPEMTLIVTSWML
ncbi:MAG: hypothetical protein H3Z52_13025, partial [archaeon]|nr:hypothetical protein [archaeon]